MKSAKQFVKQVSPRDDIGLRNQLESLKIDKHIYEWMKRYAEYYYKEKMGEIEDEEAFCIPPNLTYCKKEIHPDFDCSTCKWLRSNVALREKDKEDGNGIDD